MGSLSNDVLCDRIPNERLLENAYCASFDVLCLYKKRKVSAVRDFPPGCGRDALHINLMSQDHEAVASLVEEEENLVANENMENIAECDCVKSSEIGNGSLARQLVKSPVKSELLDSWDDLEKNLVPAAGMVKGVRLPPIMEPVGSGLPKSFEINAEENSKGLHDVETQAVVKSECAPERKVVSGVDSVVNGMVPAGGSKARSLPQLPTTNTSISKETALKIKCARRRVSATRDFPPFCGRNAPWPTKEQCILGLENRTLGALVEASVQGGLSKGTVRVKEEGSSARETARTGVDEYYGVVRDGNAKRGELKGCVPEPKRKSQNAAVQGRPLKETVTAEVEGLPLREIARAGSGLHGNIRDGTAQKRKLEGIVLEPKAKSQKVSLMGLKTRSPGNFVALGHGVDRVIVQGWMASANLSRKHEKEGGDADSSLDGMMTGSEVRRHDVSCVKGKTLSTSVSRVNVYEAVQLGEKSMKKKLLPSTKASYKSKGAQVFKVEGDFAIQQQNGSSPPAQRARDFDVILPPFGPNSSSDGNMRNKVRETLRLFHALCRKLLQGEESKLWPQGYMSKRIDLQADRIIRDRGKQINAGKQVIGSVPGVEVGDQFQYRVELALVGIHRPYQSGIDYIKHGGTTIATSIVSSGSYEDDLDNPDVLIYSGQGGNVVGRDKRPQDQKLEKGNLALKNSMTVKNPVRVIHGSKETKASTLDARPKIVLTYNYDGLYTVERYWQDVGPHGKLVFMFELKRIPGQLEVAWKEVKKSCKSKKREGLCVGDISGGKELFPICAVNTKNNEKPPKFDYTSVMKYPDRYYPTPSKGCDCIGGCSDSKNCSCKVKNGGEFPYNYNGAIVEAKTLVYECGPACKCPPSCYNRVSQHGIKIQLEIFKTQLRGWGVRSLTSIPSGSFICEYIGELLEDREAEQRENDEYLFDIGQNYSDCSLVGVSTLQSDAQLNSSGVVEYSCFTIDAAWHANVGRFINHSCSPNLYAQNVLYDHEDKRMPHIMLFAAENIPPFQELTYHYNYSVDQIRDSNGKIKMKSCYCGSAQCSGRMY